jgi:putative ABC transport system permease protein
MFAATTVLTLGLAIGANTAIFGVIESILWKPLPFPKQDRIVSVRQTAPGVGIKDLNTSAGDFFTYREESSTFADIGLWESGAETVTGLGEPERVVTMTVTAGLLPILGVQPMLGRTFTEQDDTPGAPDHVLLSYGYWQRKFGGDPAVLGKRIDAGGIARDVIGVLPRKFWFLDQKPDLLFPIKLDRGKATMGGFNFRAIALLKHSVTVAQANADVAHMIPLERNKFPMFPGMSIKMFDDARFGPNVRLLKQDAVGDVGNTLWLLMATVGLLLVTACANVGNLILVRAECRHQELAIRVALGASWAQITRELLLESLALSLIGGVAGLALAFAALRLLVTFPPVHLPRLEQLSVDGTVLLFNFSVSLFAGILFGLTPALRYRSPNLAASLRGGGRTSSQGRERRHVRDILVIVQVALALVLLIGSGLMIRTFQAMRRVQPGFTITGTIQTARLMAARVQGPAPEQIALMDQAIVERLAAIRGVQSVSMGTDLPLTTGDRAQDLIIPEDHPYQEGRLPPLRRFVSVMPGYFQTMGISLIAGRDLNWIDIQQIRPVAIVSENFAREYWGSPNAALGKRIHDPAGGRWSEIVGVVGNVRQNGVDQEAPSFVYWPLLSSDNKGNPWIPYSAHLVLRSDRAGSQSLINEIRRAVRAVNPNLPITDVRTTAEIYNQSMARTSFTLVLLLLAGVMALLLGLIGIYAVISYSVSQRTREMGIRIALGATQSQLKLMFVRHGLWLGAVGVGAGIAAAIGLARLATAVLFQISPLDPTTYGAVSLVLLTAVVLASYLPTSKVIAVDPVVALRSE